MRSSAGVGMTPPNVLGAPKPTSSVMISRMLGACLGGTMRAGHHAFDCMALSLITPPNSGSGDGNCVPLIVVVSPVEPGGPVVCMALAAAVAFGASAPKSRDVLLAAAKYPRKADKAATATADSLKDFIGSLRWVAGCGIAARRQ